MDQPAIRATGHTGPVQLQFFEQAKLLAPMSGLVRFTHSGQRSRLGRKVLSVAVSLPRPY